MSETDIKALLDRMEESRGSHWAHVLASREDLAAIRSVIDALRKKRDGAAMLEAGLTARIEGLERENASLRSRAEAAEGRLRELVNSAKAYMHYHAEKFYGDIEPKPTGLWPAIKKVEAALREGKP